MEAVSMREHSIYIIQAKVVLWGGSPANKSKCNQFDFEHLDTITCLLAVKASPCCCCPNSDKLPLASHARYFLEQIFLHFLAPTGA